MSRFRSLLFPVLGILLLAVIYVMTFPTTVQSGDTGELVTNAYFLRVIHPPGYPLFTIIYHWFLKLLSLSTVFGRASILTIAISLIWMSLLIFHFRSLASVLIILVTGSSLLFWRYALLPDVFALHLFFLTLVYLAFENPRYLQRWWFILLLGMSVSHHHTIVFALPLFLYALKKNLSGKTLITSFASGVVGLLAYLLLMKFHPEHVLSWGKLTTYSDVVSHFLRSEYGTLNLSVWKSTSYAWVSYGLEILFRNYWSLFFVLGYSIQRFRKVEKKNWLILLSALLYLGIFLVSGSISLDLSGQGVFERFLLQPLLFFVFFVLANLREVKLPPALIAVLVMNFISNVFFEWRENNFSSKTQTEDYTVNILKSLPEKSIYSPKGDTESFAAYYVKEVLGIRRDVILTPSIGILSWSEKKLSEHYPDAFLSQRGPHPIEKVNLEKYQFFSNEIFSAVPEKVSVSRFGFVYRYQLNTGDLEISKYDCSVATKYVWRNIPELADLKNFDYGYHLYLLGGNCHYDSGVLALRNSELSRASMNFTEGLRMYPLSVPLLDGKCRTLNEKKSECASELERLIEQENRQYYLYKY